MVKEIRKQRLSIWEAKEIDMVEYLSTLGFKPTKIRGDNLWYLSPLRQERTPSFKINRSLNRWYDHGIGQGGNLVDFGVLFYRCAVGEFLRGLDGHFSLHQPPPVRSLKTVVQDSESPLKIVGEFPLSSPHLLRYLAHRRIAIGVADKHCREVRYELAGKTYYGIGFRNDLGGFEIRNPYFKLSSSPKGMTTFENNSEEVIVFEGFMDFLSFKTTHQDLEENRYNFLVLNSVSFFETARPFMESHRRILLYLDRDETGQNCSRYALSMGSQYEDHSNLYRLHKDFNDWIINFGRVEQSSHQEHENSENGLKPKTLK